MSASESTNASASPSQPAVNDEHAALVERIIAGDRAALATMFTIYRPRLWRLVNFRLHPKLRGRIDPDDVLQDAWMRANDRIQHFLTDGSRSCFIWFRMIVCQTLIDVHRRHLGAEKRSAARELSFSNRWDANETSSSLAFHLQGHLTSPSSAICKAELAQQIDTILQGMDEIDREVLALRHFEQLSNSETALVLQMTEQAASARYVRAIQRLKGILQVIPDFLRERDASVAKANRE